MSSFVQYSISDSLASKIIVFISDFRTLSDICHMCSFLWELRYEIFPQTVRSSALSSTRAPYFAFSISWARVHVCKKWRYLYRKNSSGFLHIFEVAPKTAAQLIREELVLTPCQFPVRSMCVSHARNSLRIVTQHRTCSLLKRWRI